MLFRSGQAIADHEHTAGKAEEEAKPGVEGAVVGARVVADLGDDGPKDAASQGKGEHETVVNPVHRGVAGFAGVPVSGDAGEMKEMLASELGEMVEGPVELVFDPGADDRERTKEGSVAAEEAEAEEVEEGDAESEADCWAPGSGRSRGGDGRGQFAGRGDAWMLQRDLAWGRSGSWTILVQGR